MVRVARGLRPCRFCVAKSGRIGCADYIRPPQGLGRSFGSRLTPADIITPIEFERGAKPYWERQL